MRGRTKNLAVALPLAALVLLVGRHGFADPDLTVPVTASADTWISQSPSHKNHGDDRELEVGGNSRARALVAFSTEELLAATRGRRIVAARLELGIDETSSQWGQLAFGTAAR